MIGKAIEAFLSWFGLGRFAVVIPRAKASLGFQLGDQARTGISVLGLVGLVGFIVSVMTGSWFLAILSAVFMVTVTPLLRGLPGVLWRKIRPRAKVVHWASQVPIATLKLAKAKRLPRRRDVITRWFQRADR